MGNPIKLTYTKEPEFHGLALKSKWLKALNLKSHCKKDVVCINHFRQKFDYCLLPNGKYRLGKGAVPSLCLKTSDSEVNYWNFKIRHGLHRFFLLFSDKKSL